MGINGKRDFVQFTGLEFITIMQKYSYDKDTLYTALYYSDINMVKL